MLTLFLTSFFVLFYAVLLLRFFGAWEHTTIKTRLTRTKRVAEDYAKYANFTPIRPASDAPEDVRSHRKTTQTYLMDAWEQRFEVETGADLLRLDYVAAKNEADRARKASYAAREQTRNRFSAYHYGDEYIEHSSGRYRYRDDGVIAIEEHRDDCERRALNILHDYNRRLGLPPNARMREFNYKAWNA